MYNITVPTSKHIVRPHPQKTKCVFTVRSHVKKIYGLSIGISFFSFLTIGKAGNSRSRFRNPIPVFHFRNYGKPSYVEAVLWRVAQFFYLLCSDFRQKDSGRINKTLLLIKQQKWLSEFRVNIYRIASKN